VEPDARAESCVLALWMDGAEKGEIVGEFPPDTQRMALVVNGRLLHSAPTVPADAIEVALRPDTDL
jgi:hypothetical protein